MQLNDVLSLGQHRIWKRMAVKWSGASKGQQALDVCCGSGDLAFRLAEVVGPTGHVSNRPDGLAKHTTLAAFSCKDVMSVINVFQKLQ